MNRLAIIIVLAVSLVQDRLAWGGDVNQDFRPSCPVVVTGKDVAALLGAAPNSIVGFSWRDGKWVQVPVQVDQKVLAPKGNTGNPAVPLKARWKSHYIFADPKNAAGPGGATLGDHDEIALLYEEFGDPAGAAATDPAGVVPKLRVDLKATQQGQPRRWLSLFKSTGELKPDAGRKAVGYHFHSLIAPEDRQRWEEITTAVSNYRYSPEHKENENKVSFELPPLPSEDSTVHGENYHVSFDARTSLSEMKILSAGASGDNILEHDKFYYSTAAKNKSWLVSIGNRILADIVGPVRAIRLRQLEWSAVQGYDAWIFYPRTIETARHWIIHPGPEIWFGMNFSANAEGMTYYDNLNEQGVTIDGQPDEVRTGELKWQFLTGKPGSLVIQHNLDTNIPDLARRSRYFDVKDPHYYGKGETGVFAYGASGPLYGPCPATVPKGEPGDYMVIRRRFLFGPPGLSLDQVKAVVEQPLTKLEVINRKDTNDK